MYGSNRHHTVLPVSSSHYQILSNLLFFISFFVFPYLLGTKEQNSFFYLQRLWHHYLSTVLTAQTHLWLTATAKHAMTNFGLLWIFFFLHPLTVVLQLRLRGQQDWSIHHLGPDWISELVWNVLYRFMSPRGQILLNWQFVQWCAMKFDASPQEEL